MFIEIHTIQNFAPSNLNRDDTGSPKDCEFGGHRRARVSSQCWKRAVREYFSQEQLIPEAQRGVRTKKLVGKVASLLIGRNEERKPEEVTAVAAAVVEAFGVGFDAKSKEEKKTSVLLFLGNDQIEALASLCHQHWDQILAESKKKKSALPKDLISKLRSSLQGSSAADLALFGRMVAEDPGLNVDAACRVAHALSTHRVAPEFDYYTAVDDLGREDETGAGMLGTQEFNSACFYRYANIDLQQLERNLQNDRELALSGVRAFLESFIMAIPKAKQNSTAAQNLPSFVMIVVRNKGLASLANAFARPVDGRKEGLMVNSVEALASYWGKLRGMYGPNGLRSAFYATTEDVGLDMLNLNGAQQAPNVQELLTKAISDLGGA
jgi:CRISPR system Cascade subunit CasC